ncbi:MAG: heme-binding protein [Gammaproteobacteria bacterium]|nr:heme-binding protein [Gammaproteobacteria bacterium]MDH3431577.1 heme-binding protein [Gammaproteobacteria bacterium]
MSTARRVFLRLVGGLLSASLAAPLFAENALVTFKSLAPETALAMARAALKSCRDEGYQVSVAVVDRMGVTQVVLRDRFAGPHTPGTSQDLAWTAVSFRGDTLTLAENSGPHSPQSGSRQIENVIMIGGGIPVTVSGSIVAGIGISGTPSGEANHACARAGIDAVAADLELAD